MALKEKLFSKLNIVNITLIITTILLMIGILLKIDSLVISSIILVTLLNFIVSLSDLPKHIIFLFYTVTFNVFLTGRFLLNSIFFVDMEYTGLYELGFYDDNIARLTVTLIAVALVSFSMGYYIFNEIRSTKVKEESKVYFEVNYNKSKIYFYIMEISMVILFIIKVIYLIISIKNIKEIGYFSNQLVAIEGKLKFLRFLSDVSYFLFIFYLANKPTIKKTTIFSVLFLATSFLEIFTGSRNGFILNVILIIIYFIVRLKIRLNIKKILVLILVSIALVFTMISVGNSRGTVKSHGAKKTYSYNKLVRFIYDQGVSARVIGNVELYKEEIPDKIYSFGLIDDYIKYDVMGKIFKKNKVLQGQSVDYAYGRTQLSHILSYLQSPFEYLNLGLGTGSSYIAELYHDFKLFGVVIGSMLLGFLCSALSNFYSFKNIFIRYMSIIIIRDFAFIPRAQVLSFLSKIILNTGFLCLFAFILYYLICGKLKWRENGF